MRTGKLLLGACVALGMVGATASALQGPRTFTFRVHKIAQIDNLDKIDALGSDKADFYAVLFVNGKQMGRTKNFSADEGYANWRWNISTWDRFVNLKLRIYDDDGGLEGTDDHVDINPMPEKRDIEIRYDTVTGRYTGDIQGTKGSQMRLSGEGKDPFRGEVTFSVD